MIKALIFDLDSCLCAANEVGDDLFAPAFAAIRGANDGTVSEERLEAAFAACWRFPFNFVAANYGFSNTMFSAGFEAFRHLEVRAPMHGYGDLAVLAELPAKLFLVTTGFRRLQESKVKALGIASLFTTIHIDAIDESPIKGKDQIFAELLKADRLRPQELLVVGDNPDSEIAAGNRLGIRTVQILRPGVPRSPAATVQIQNLHDLKRLFRDEMKTTLDSYGRLQR
jgi:putative hydrolase of the HAD superfamily